jgi:LacI family transcriptional regulator
MAGAEPDWSLDLAKLGQWLNRLPKPLAVLCWNASSAREIIFACHETGILVPEQVAVLSASHDETLCETSLVPISGIAAAGERIGQQAAEVLDLMMKGGGPPTSTTLVPPQGIVARQSTETLAIEDPALVKALSFLRKNAGRSVRVNEIARQAGVSRRVLERRFQERLQRSPADEIRRFQLDQARRLLVETDLSIGQVAENSGFCSHVYFSNIFRRHFGTRPVEYRKKYRVRPARYS